MIGLNKQLRWILFIFTLAYLPTQVMAQDKPNIVIVFMDNFGWGEPGFNGGGVIRGAPTPRMDTLADEGLRLTNFNVEVHAVAIGSHDGAICNPKW